MPADPDTRCMRAREIRADRRSPKRRLRLFAVYLSILLVASLSPTSAGAQLVPAGQYETRGDYVHVTSGEASGHGWWVKLSGPATMAKVKIKLQTKKIRRFWFDTWPDATDWNDNTVRSGGGSRKRANARRTCNGTTVTPWRSVVDVDIIGYPDPPDVHVTPARFLECGK